MKQNNFMITIYSKNVARGMGLGCDAKENVSVIVIQLM
jgi:hypothetical protein